MTNSIIIEYAALWSATHRFLYQIVAKVGYPAFMFGKIELGLQEVWTKYRLTALAILWEIKTAETFGRKYRDNGSNTLTWSTLISVDGFTLFNSKVLWQDQCQWAI